MKGIKFNRILIVSLGLIMLTGISAISYAQVPRTISYQGYLIDSAGDPVNGTVDMTFRIYTSADPLVEPVGSQSWIETHTLMQVTQGVYSVVLGSAGSPLTLNFNMQYWLGIEVGTDGEMDPRQQLTAVPYALNADTVNGAHAASLEESAEIDADILTHSSDPHAHHLEYDDERARSAMGIQDDANSLNHVKAIYSAGNGLILSGTQYALDYGQLDSAYWSLTGNTGTTPGTNFLGTTDNQPLELHVNSNRALRIEPSTNSPNLIGGHSGNTVSNGTYGATIGGGGTIASLNQVTAMYGTVGGGRGNTASGAATVSGGGDNTAGEIYAAVGGGQQNQANSPWSTVSGGTQNTANAVNATIGGGVSNTSSGDDATVGGGAGNSASAQGSVVGGGAYNRAAASYATIGGGGPSTPGDPDTSNLVSENYGTIGGGARNFISDGDSTVNTPSPYATIGGGYSNYAAAQAATVSGGANNIARAISSAVGGGRSNEADGEAATVGGGFINLASASYATISGGGPSIPNDPLNTRNRVTDDYGVIGGGGGNQAGDNAGTAADASYATVAGGESNEASGAYSFVGGGAGNSARGLHASVSGGAFNSALGDYATIAGGGPLDPFDPVHTSNRVTDNYSTVGGGAGNQAGADGGAVFGVEGATVGGGLSNTASGIRSTVSGGSDNTASGFYSTVSGGLKAVASKFGQYAYASGGFDLNGNGGDAQTSLYVLRNTTSDATPTPLYTNPVFWGFIPIQGLTIAPDQTMSFDILISASTQNGQDIAGYQIKGLAQNFNNVLRFTGIPVVTVLGEDPSAIAWDATVRVNNVDKSLEVMVTGAPQTDIRWVASARTVEVTFPSPTPP